VASRKGIDLERLVVRLEMALADPSATVKRNDRIPDLVTKRLREIDVSIRRSVGSVPVLVIVECRDRRRRQDVEWIEQVASKRDSVGADAAVVVTTNGLTHPATLKAQNLGVRVYRIKDITAQDVKSWFSVENLTVSHPNVHFYKVDVEFVDPNVHPHGEFVATGIRVTDAVFRMRKTGTKVSLLDIWDQAAVRARCDGHDFYAKLATGSPRRLIHPTLRYPNPDTQFQIAVDGAFRDIASATVTCEIWVVEEEVPPSNSFSYGPEDLPIADVVEYPVPGPDGKRTVRFLRNRQTESLSISVSPPDETRQQL